MYWPQDATSRPSIQKQGPDKPRQTQKSPFETWEEAAAAVTEETEAKVATIAMDDSEEDGWEEVPRSAGAA